jgi:nitrogen regulatory protein P-II 1
MKKVEAIIRPSKLKAVQEGLKNAGMPCLTVVPVKGTGLQKSYSERYRGSEQTMILQTRIMIICIVSDEKLDLCVDVFLDCAGTDQVGDGKIFVYDVLDAIRISNRTRGSGAIK